MRRAWLLIVASAIGIALSAPPAFCQETTGQLEGRVLDAQAKPVSYADVVVSGPSLQGTRGALTNREGLFVLMALPVGEYSVKVSHVAHKEQILKDVRIRLGQTTSLGDVRLQEEVYRQEEVVVTGRAPLIDPSSTVMGANLAASDYAALPVERNYLSVTTILPQANQSYLGDPVNFAGSTGLENRYFIDGIDVSDSYRGKVGTALPYNFVEEVQVKTGGYEAEYRSSLGGTVNVVTYSGSNKVSGQVFGFFTNNTFSATPRSLPDAVKKGDFARYDVGFGIGGPIQLDRLWYYAAYNPTRQQEDVEIPGWGFYEDWSTTHSFAGKLTWRANEKNTFVFSAIGDPSRRREVGSTWAGVPSVPPANVDPFLFKASGGSLNFMLDGRHDLRDNLLIQTSLSRSTREDRGSPETERGRTEMILVDELRGVVSGGAPLRWDTKSTVNLAKLHCTWFTGNHELKAGLEYKDNGLDINWTAKHVTLLADSTYRLVDFRFKGKVNNRVPSAFLQDSWRVTERLRVNAGLRWDGQYFISSERKVAQTILDGWQPRGGFTYQPGRPGSQKVFGSFGRFYQELNTAALSWYYSADSRWAFLSYDHDPRLDPSGAEGEWSGGAIQSKRDLEGQYFDEFTLGYERQAGAKAKIGGRGVYRTLRQGLEDGMGSAAVVLGNPGRGEMSAFPRMKRQYSALELSYQHELSERLTLLGFYVLSRTYGNYEGLFDTILGNQDVNATALFDAPSQLVNGTGLLPGDRTHVFKLTGSYRLREDLTLGAIGIWESGSPLTEFGTNPNHNDVNWIIILRQRGSAGRTPSIWDLNLRLAYQPPISTVGGFQPKLTIDWLHIASQRRPVTYDQMHYYGTDEEGNQTDPNPRYMKATGWQPPMAVRMGVEVPF